MEAIPSPARREQVRLIRRLLQTPQTVLDELNESFGPVCGLGAGPLRMVVVGSPKLIRELLMQPNDRFRWNTRLSPFPFVIGKHTMIASDGPDHRRRRGAAQQAFGRRRLNRWIPMIVERRAGVRHDRVALDALIDTAIADSRSEPSPIADGIESGDVLDALVHRSDLSDAEIRDQVKSLIGAGYDTTASSLAWILWEATTHPHLWKRLRDEADIVFGPPGAQTEPDERTFAALELANRTMRESLRLHPASGVGAREAATDVRVGVHSIPKGTLVLWSPYLAGRDTATWADSDRFDPDRFLDLDEVQRAIADDGWVPFGRGPRMCVGFALAQMELTLIIARLAQRLDLTPTTPRLPEPAGLIVSLPVGGAPMYVSPRTSPA